MADFNIFSHLNTMGFGRGNDKNAAPSDGANEKESAQIVVDAAGEKIAGVASKMLGVPNLTQLGSISITKQMDSEGLVNSNIPSLINQLNARGGIIAQIAHTLIKNGVIQDQAQFHNLAGGVGDDALASNVGNFASPLPADAPIAPIGGRDDAGGLNA